MKKKVISLLLISAMTASMVAGCGDSSSSDTQKGDSKSATTVDDGHTLTVWAWDASFNISANRNKVLKLGPEDAPIITSAGVSHAYFKTEVGQPIGNYFLLIQDGVF